MISYFLFLFLFVLSLYSRFLKSNILQDFRNFEVGDTLDAKDTVNKWYEAEIEAINVKNQSIFVHYIGWGVQWNQWIQMDSADLAGQGWMNSVSLRILSTILRSFLLL